MTALRQICRGSFYRELAADNGSNSDGVSSVLFFSKVGGIRGMTALIKVTMSRQVIDSLVARFHSGSFVELSDTLSRRLLKFSSTFNGRHMELSSTLRGRLWEPSSTLGGRILGLSSTFDRRGRVSWVIANFNLFLLILGKSERHAGESELPLPSQYRLLRPPSQRGKRSFR